jgi:type VI secretion system protein ImpF
MMHLSSFLSKISESRPLDSGAFKGDSLGIFLADLKKDLENLLNSRRQPFSLPLEYKEVPLSVLGYGLDDFSGHLGFSESTLHHLSLDIEKTIRLYETRLTNVRVTPLASETNNRRSVLFKIEGTLSAEGKTVSVFSHLNLHRRNQLYSLYEWSFDYGG